MQLKIDLLDEEGWNPWDHMSRPIDEVRAELGITEAEDVRIPKAYTMDARAS